MRRYINLTDTQDGASAVNTMGGSLTGVGTFQRDLSFL